MVALREGLGLGPDQFAFYFQGDAGVEAKDLGTFLQRAATVARRQGTELRVTAIEPGSIAVILRALKKTGKAAGKEIQKAPIATTAAVAGVVSAIVLAMQPSSGPTPLAKAAADVVEHHNVQRIEVITFNQTVVVMDPPRAQRVRQMEREQHQPDRLSALEAPREEIRQLVDAARHGFLAGHVVTIHGELYFCPDGQTFYVPIQTSLMDPEDEIYADAHFRVRADLIVVRGQPNRIVVYSAEPV